MKAYCGRSVDFRDPFAKERYRGWERNHTERYDQFYKGCAVGAQPRPPVNSENFSPERFGPKMDKTKQKVEVAVPPKKENILKRAKASQEKVDTDRAKSAQMEPPVKKVKEE